MDEYPVLGKKVESYGFDRIAIYNNMLYQPAWFPLLTIAQVTSKILIGPSALNPYTSHPINIAGNLALLDEISNARAYLGLSRGAWLNFAGISTSKPIKALKEAFECIQHLLHQDKEALPGEFYSLSGGDSLRWRIVRKNIPMQLASWGLKALEACYTYINEMKIGGTANPEFMKYMKNQIDQIKTQNKYSNTVNLVSSGVCVVDYDSEKAKEAAKKEVALYLPIIAQLDPTAKVSKSTLEEMEQAANQFDYTLVGEMISDELLDQFVYAGTPEEIILHAKKVFTKGAQRIEFGSPHGLDRDEGLDLLGLKVIPELREFIDSSIN